jgi:hypothetical protein
MDEKRYLPNNTDIYEQEYENEYENLAIQEMREVREVREHKPRCNIMPFVATRMVGLTDINLTEYNNLRCYWRAQSEGSCIAPQGR